MVVWFNTNFMGGDFLNNKIYKWQFTVPALLFYTIFFIAPVLMGFYYAMTDWNAIKLSNEVAYFVGFDNFIKIFFNAELSSVISRTLGFGLVTTIFRVAYKMISSGYKVGVYTKSGDYIWMGNSYFINEINSTNIRKFEKFTVEDKIFIDVIERNNGLVQSLNKYPYSETEIEKMICISRAIMLENTFTVPSGVLEIQVPYQELEKLMRNIITDDWKNNMKVSIYNKQGIRLYGEISTSESLYIYDHIIKVGSFNKNGNIVRVIPIMSGNLFVVSEISQNKLYASLRNYIVISLLAFIALNVLLLLITYKISNVIMSPIKKICYEIDQVKIWEIENMKKIHMDTDIIEIKLLGQTIENMQIKISNSIDEIVSLKSYEIQSKMWALQAQMQPHFLYNTIMTIAAMAEEGGNNDVSRTCCNLTNMLRYISSENTDTVAVEDELKHLEDYVKIMRERFSEIEVQQNVPLVMFQIRVPKLIIQPLVENSLKYCGKVDAEISINGSVEGIYWNISVSDNGIGFTQDKINEILSKGKECAENYRTAKLSIDGMGLINIYIRLKMRYGDHMIFEIKNNEISGCSIKIGGTL